MRLIGKTVSNDTHHSVIFHGKRREESADHTTRSNFIPMISNGNEEGEVSGDGDADGTEIMAPDLTCI